MSRGEPFICFQSSTIFTSPISQAFLSLLQTPSGFALYSSSSPSKSSKILGSKISYSDRSSLLILRMSLIRCTQRSDACLASRLTRTKLRNPCGSPSRTSRWTSLPMERRRLANITESSNIGSKWQACAHTKYKMFSIGRIDRVTYRNTSKL